MFHVINTEEISLLFYRTPLIDTIRSGFATDIYIYIFYSSTKLLEAVLPSYIDRVI